MKIKTTSSKYVKTKLMIFLLLGILTGMGTGWSTDLPWGPNFSSTPPPGPRFRFHSLASVSLLCKAHFAGNRQTLWIELAANQTETPIYRGNPIFVSVGAGKGGWVGTIYNLFIPYNPVFFADYSGDNIFFRMMYLLNK